MTSDILLNRVRNSLIQQQCFGSNRLLVVAVSGGPDSLCLLHILWRLQTEGGPMVHVAHLDHCFRGEQSAAEARFVAQIASEWGVPATIEQYDVLAFADAQHQNRQAAARVVRYAFLARIARSVAADAVAVAHHANDQAETVLLHMLRGAGPAGLRGMRAVVPWHEWAIDTTTPADGSGALPKPPLIRPLIDTPRSEIEHYCAENYLTPQHDPSNAAPSYTRNRIRSDLVPHLAAYNPQIVAALARTAQVCADDYAYIQAQLDAIWPDLVDEHATRIAFRAARWQALPTALQRYALRRAAAQLADDDLSYEQVETARAAASGTAGHRHVLAQGIILRVRTDTFELIQSITDHADLQQRDDQTVPQLAASPLPLAVPGTTPISPTWCAQVHLQQPDTLPADEQQRWCVVLNRDALDGALLLRCRRAGDRFRPAGGQGSRLLQDFFVDQKVPRELRDAWPILATTSTIVWIAGLRADARFYATPQTEHMLWVILHRHIASSHQEHEEPGHEKGMVE